MISISHPQNIALLIDADNVSSSIKEILEIVDYYGELEIAHAYRDWRNSPKLRKKFQKSEIECVQVDNVGKNATDNRILFEIGEMIAKASSGNLPIELFILVSGDGDFASVCESIKQRGWPVIGIGIVNPESDLEKSCDKFYHIDKIADEILELQKKYPIHPSTFREFFSLLRSIYQNFFKPYTWISYDDLDKKLHEIEGYTLIYGRYKLSEWLKHFTEYFEHRGDMVRSVDPIPSFTRQSLLHTAYKRTKQRYNLVDLDQFRSVLQEFANEWAADIYETYFGGQHLSEWIAMYPNDYEIQGQYITRPSIDKNPNNS
jgi:hypothetical protein